MPRDAKSRSRLTIPLSMLVALALPSIVAVIAIKGAIPTHEMTPTILPQQYLGTWEAFQPVLRVCGNAINPPWPKLAPLPAGTRKSMTIGVDGQVAVLYETSAGALRRTSTAKLVTENLNELESNGWERWLVLVDDGELSLVGGIGGYVGPVLRWADSNGNLSYFRRKS